MRTFSSLPRLSSLFFVSLLLLLAACGQNTTGQSSSATPAGTAKPAAIVTPVALDQYGTPIVFPQQAPQRIVSLAPSSSEILGDLNLQSKVVGVDFYTNYPASFASIKKISDANGKFSIEQIIALKPDLVLSSGGITKDADTQLMQHSIHVVDLPSANLSEVLQQIQIVGRLTGTQSTANTLSQQLQNQVDQVKVKVARTETPSVLLEVDDSTPGKPYVFGGGSFGDELLQDAGAMNIFHGNTANGGYPQVTDESVLADNPQYVILTEDPAYGGNPDSVYKRSGWSGIQALKDHHVYHLNTDIMQRPGPRLVEGLRCVAQVVHPDKFTDPLPDYCQAKL